MNNSLDRVYDDLVRLLRDDVIPQLAGDAVRSQVFGAIFMLNNLQRRTDWSAEPLVGEIRAQDALFARLRDVAPAQAQGLPTVPRIAADLPDGKRLMALRDEGNALVSALVLSPSIAADGEAMALMADYMRAELDMEMKHTPKPMFAEMSSGKSSAAG